VRRDERCSPPDSSLVSRSLTARATPANDDVQWAARRRGLDCPCWRRRGSLSPTASLRPAPQQLISVVPRGSWEVGWLLLVDSLALQQLGTCISSVPQNLGRAAAPQTCRISEQLQKLGSARIVAGWLLLVDSLQLRAAPGAGRRLFRAASSPAASADGRQQGETDRGRVTEVKEKLRESALLS